MSEGLYYKLYSKIGGRPWTYIIRDFYHKYEYLIIIYSFSAGFFLRPHCSIKEFLIGAITATIGLILGHLFWGTPYVEGQRGDT